MWRAEKTTFWAKAKVLYNHDMNHRGCSGTTVMTALLPGSFRKLIHPFIAVEWEWTRFTELPHVNTKAPQVSWSFEMSLPIARSSKKTNRLFKVKNQNNFYYNTNQNTGEFAGRKVRKERLYIFCCLLCPCWMDLCFEVWFLPSQRQSCRKMCLFPLISWKVISIASKA